MAGALYFTRDELRDEFSDEVKKCGARIREIHPHVFWAEGDKRLYWVLDFWPQAIRLPFDSINDAAKKLRSLGRHWAYFGGANFRRGQLIAETLRIKKSSAGFSPAAVNPPCGAFTLENEKTLIYTLTPLKRRFAGGKVTFNEDKEGPPSRAYLKLWEALTLTGSYPAKNDTVLDLGATPGGWSYVAASLGAEVTMIDRSPPDAKLMKKFPRLKFITGDGLRPPRTELEKARFILSDMACEPVKLLESVRDWLTLKEVKVMICTLKFHGTSDKGTIADFAKIPGSEVYHLWQNGHELTWIWQGSDSNKVSRAFR